MSVFKEFIIPLQSSCFFIGLYILEVLFWDIGIFMAKNSWHHVVTSGVVE
jgi:hypothetical protein